MHQQRELARRISNYRRHNEFSKTLLEKVLAQSEKNGIGYVLSNVSDEARELDRKSRQVGCECHHAQAFLRFEEVDGALVGSGEFEHNVEEPVLYHFMRRFPKKKVILISKGKAYVGEGRSIRIESPKDYIAPKTRELKTKDPVWEAFYDSQYIPARRNRKLAMKGIPKKLWKKFGISEGVKIDYGVPSSKISDFM